jgi:plasmid stabilization system protein ParE
MRVRYTLRATHDLSDIFAYIRKESPLAAARMVDRIEAVAAELGHNPGMGIATGGREFTAFR